MKMKRLTCSLLSLLAGSASIAFGQQVAPNVDGDPVKCDSQSCSSNEGVLFLLRSRSYDEPVTQGTDERSSSAALQPDRRVTISQPAPGLVQATGKFSIALPDGGAIWATEDPSLGQPELSVSGQSMAPFDGERITKPVQFATRSNYAPFIQRMEILLYRGTDTDLVQPIGVIPMKSTTIGEVQWTGALPPNLGLHRGNTLVYVLRAYDADGAYDETYPQKIQLVSPEEEARNLQQIRDSAEQSLGSALSIDQAQSQSLINNVFSGNGLRLQNIPIYGSRIRIQGRNLPPRSSLSINGEPYPVDLQRKFAAEYLVPIGKHSFDIALVDPDKPGGAPEQHQTLDVDVTGHYFFAVGLADVTVMQGEVARSLDPSASGGHYKDDVISDGRLAFYLKTKINGKYLITAQADTTDQEIKHLFSGFTNATPNDIFRQLDPDLYYPTYGDDSTTYRDVDTMGRFYFRVDWDKNQALWGNYATGFTGTEFAQYVRSLYGAAATWRSQEINLWGNPKTEVRAFGSEAQSAPGHNEFLGTGGSLYYLKNTDILPGSDIAFIEVRDPTTGRIVSRTALQRGADYEIDTIQGRIILTQPLAQVTRQNVPTLTRDQPQDGYQQRLVVDYEWVPSGFDANDITGGVRAKHWFGDHVGVGATYVDEAQAGQDYKIEGVDVTLQAGRGTYLKTEYVHTQSISAPIFVSTNGGFSFSQASNANTRQDGDAKSIEGKVDFKEMGWTTLDWSAAAWWRDTTAGYHSDLYNTGIPMREYGTELLGQLSPAVRLYARYSRAESGANTLTQAQGTLEWRLDENDTISGEIRRVEENLANGNPNATGVLGAVKYDHRFGTSLDLYGLAQATLDNDGGRYADNNALVAGGKYLIGDKASVNGEYSTGDRGDAATLGGEYRLGPNHSIYGNYARSTDTTADDSIFNPNLQNGWTVGQRWHLSSQTNLYNESQFLKEPQQNGIAHTFGMDFYPAQGWNVGYTLQTGDLTDLSGGTVSRKAISLSGGRTTPLMEWQSKVEWRRDRGAETRTEWVTTNRLAYTINDSWRVAARLNYSDTGDVIDPTAKASFTEANLGFAWRPWNSTRWSLFGRYTYLYDLASPGQDGGAQYDQRTQVFSLEGVYKYDQHWEYAVKLARRDGSVRMQRGSGPWFDSGTNFYAAQVRYELRTQWHAMAEYRWLDVDHGGNKQGVLVGLDRDISKNFRIGVGYNFTDFKDDLTNFSYDNRGWFLNVTGIY